jgi:TniQ
MGCLLNLCCTWGYDYCTDFQATCVNELMTAYSSDAIHFAFPWAPRIEVDELPPSYQHRACLMSALINQDEFVRRMSGRMSGSQSGLEFGIAQMGATLRELGANFSRGFLEEHCLSALGLPFCTPEKEDKKRASLSNGSDPVGWRGFGMELISTWSPYHQCSICVSEDIEEHGFSYWRRVPQIVGVQYCPTHRVKITDRCADCGAYLRSHVLPASACFECGTSYQAEPIDQSDERALLEFRFADAVEGIFSGRITGPMTSTTIRQRIVELFPERPGLPGMVLVDYVEDTVDPMYLELLGLSIDKHNKFQWPIGLCAPGVIFDDALIQLFTYALLSRDRRRENMFRPDFPSSPRWLVKSHPRDAIDRVGMRWPVENSSPQKW